MWVESLPHWFKLLCERLISCVLRSQFPTREVMPLCVRDEYVLWCVVKWHMDNHMTLNELLNDSYLEFNVMRFLAHYCNFMGRFTPQYFTWFSDAPFWHMYAKLIHPWSLYKSQIEKLHRWRSGWNDKNIKNNFIFSSLL